MKSVRTKFIAAIAGLALAAGTSLATPSPAEAKHEAAWAIGGLVAGLALGHAAQGYARPYHYGAPYVHVAPRCWWTKQKVWDPWYGPTWQRVRVCR
jgi:hypothetical protein